MQKNRLVVTELCPEPLPDPLTPLLVMLVT